MTYTRSAITTVDNPFNPFDDFDNWLRYDQDCGYCSCDYLARLANTSDSLSVVEYANEVSRAIDQIILYDPTGIYRKVTESVTLPD